MKFDEQNQEYKPNGWRTFDQKEHLQFYGLKIHLSIN